MFQKVRATSKVTKNKIKINCGKYEDTEITTMITLNHLNPQPLTPNS